MTSPLSQAPAIHPVEEVDLVQNLLHALNLGLALAQAARAMTIIMLTKMTVGQICPSSMGVCVSDLRLRLGYCKCMRYQSLVPSR